MKKKWIFASLLSSLLLFGSASANTIYTVKKGDNLSSIAKKYKTNTNIIQNKNGLKEQTLYVGQRLTITKQNDKTSPYQWVERGKDVAEYARTLIGFPEKKGGESLNEGFDSSGLVYWVLYQQGIKLDRTTVSNYYKLSEKTNSPKQGDLIFFLSKDKKEPKTVGIYTENGYFVHVGMGGKGVQLKHINNTAFHSYNIEYKTFIPKGEYVVQKGDTLKKIANSYKISEKTIQKRNDLHSSVLYEGQHLQLYGDNLFNHYTKETPRFSNAYNIIRYAYTYRGFHYVWSEETPDKGMDCSGFIQWVFQQQGYKIPRYTASTLQTKTTPVTIPKPGDLVFFKNTGKRTGITHVGIYIGENYFLHTTEKAGVHISHLDETYFKEKFHSFGSITPLLKK